MMKPIEQLKALLNAGAALVVDANGTPTNGLIELAAQARASGAHITFSNVRHKPTTDLEKIAAEGGKAVTFDLSEAQ
jgi:hypothetical protein